MTHYRANRRDLEFNLFEVFGAGDLMGHGPFASMDAETAREVLREVERLATGRLAEPFSDTDRHPPAYDPETRSVTMPDGFRKAFQALAESEWWRLDLPEHLGGTGAPPSLRWAAAEMLLGSNPAAYMYMAGPGFASVVDALGTPDQQHWAKLMIERSWGATMVLTEPDAGSDVGAGRATAIDNGNGTWSIEGVKRFITSGEHDLTENIIHLVLARPAGAGPGTKGLSLFFVPKFLFDPATGQLGERNGVWATNVERKMGLKASTTCELTFGERTPAVGWLVGDVHDGIAQMFKVIEYARMMVGTKAIATLSTGYLNALDYAKTRVQGADLADMGDRDAPRVAIIRHPDVRRSLMLQKSYAEGLRALVAYTSSWQDRIELANANGSEEDALEASRMNDLLLPIVKGVGSERSYELLASSLQVLGGSGFLQDYPIEQYVRDAKIDTLYEGTTAIQGLDLFFRKMVKDQFRSVGRLAGEIRETASQDGGLGDERALLGAALDDVQGIIALMGGWTAAAMNDPQEIYRVGLNTTRLLMAAGDLLIGWLLIRQAQVAAGALEAEPDGRDREFYEGKIATAGWFARNRLPLLAGERAGAAATTLDLMELPDGSL